MSGKRIRIVTVQAVIVGALLLVVYLTLLRPEDQKPLFGVGVPSGPGQVAQVPGGEPGEPGGAGGHGAGAHGGGARGERGHHGEGGDRHGGGGKAQAGGPGGASGAVSGSAVGGAPAGPAIPTRDGAESGVTPSEQQYGDTVSQLFGNL